MVWGLSVGVGGGLRRQEQRGKYWDNYNSIKRVLKRLKNKSYFEKNKNKGYRISVLQNETKVLEMDDGDIFVQ